MKLQKELAVIFLLPFLAVGCTKSNAEVNSERSEAEKNTVKFSRDLQQSSGVVTVAARNEKLVATLEVYGSISQDTDKSAHVTAKDQGVLETLKVEPGAIVEAGSLIAVIRTTSGEKKDLLSPSRGIVLALYSKEGDTVDSISSILTIADPSLLRASFDIYEKDAAFIAIGQLVKVTAVAFPSKEFAGQIVFISPRVDEETRTIKIRVDVENKEYLLKYGMFVTGDIQKPSEKEAILVPLESVHELEGKNVVFVKKDDELFEVRKVKTGGRNSSDIEILEGVAPNEEIVSKGSFYLKSELLKDTLGEEE